MMSWRKGATLTGTSTPSPILPHCPRSHLSLYFFVTLYLYLSCTSFFVFFLYLDKDRFYLSIIFDRSRSRCVKPLQQSTFHLLCIFPDESFLLFPKPTLCPRQMQRRRLWSIVRDLRLLSQICVVPYRAVHVQHFCGMCQTCARWDGIVLTSGQFKV